MRTSDRIFMEVPITISGTDPSGRQFVESTRALVLSRRGARIISREPLVPEQVLAVRCLTTGLDTPVRVIGPIMGKGEACHFGLAFLKPDVNVWGIKFPLLDGTENPAGRVFLACSACHAQEVVHLDVFELEVFLANACISRHCFQCFGSTLWTRVKTAGEEDGAAQKAVPKPRHTIQERRWPRVAVKVAVCLRHPEYGQEIVTTENVSRGGFRVRSQTDFGIGSLLEVALPYSPGASNIFTPARIVHKELGIGAETFVYGIAYVPSPLARSLTGLRITQSK